MHVLYTVSRERHKFSISNKLLDEADATGPWTTLWKAGVYVVLLIPLTIRLAFNSNFGILIQIQVNRD